MSLISDALKKVQQEREKANQKETLPVMPVKKRPLLLIGIVLVIAVLALNLILLRSPARVASQQQSQEPLFKSPQTHSQQNTVATQEALVEKERSDSASGNQNESRGVETVEKEVSQTGTAQTNLPQAKPEPAADQKRSLAKEPERKVRVQKTFTDTEEKKAAAENTEQLTAAGDTAFQQKDYLTAYDNYSKALNQRPADRELYKKVYRVLRAAENWPLARTYLQQALRLWPEDYELAIGYLITLLKSGDYQSVVDVSTRLIDVYPGDSALLTYRGLGYFHLKQYQQAEENFSRSLRLSATGFENYYYLGLIADNLKNYQQACSFYRQFLNLAQEDSKFSRHIKFARERVRLIEKNSGGEQ